jgi:hypothetical protein
MTPSRDKCQSKGVDYNVGARIVTRCDLPFTPEVYCR